MSMERREIRLKKGGAKMIKIEEGLINDLQKEALEAEKLMQCKTDELKKLCEISKSMIDELEELKDEIWDCSLNIASKVDEIRQAILS